ncbi:hypothetical protein, partial [Crocosphaera watsonii]
MVQSIENCYAAIPPNPVSQNGSTQPSLTYTERRQQRIDWLLSNGLPPLPVAPYQDPHRYHKVVKASNTRGAHCPLTKDLQPI